MRKMDFCICIIFGCVLAVGAGGFLLGWETAPDAATSSLSWEQCDTIYVKILEKQDNYFHVEGLSVNDINGQGEYTFSLEENVKLLWRGTEITAADLQVGDNLAITYNGEVLETYPAQFTQVLQIKKLS
ncbi:MAG: DUF3221 domain-containing protein [Oscillospiraceae bacterium]|nr:DUF3221 domain-containing protein [Oscillospiraceae bacterium]